MVRIWSSVNSTSAFLYRDVSGLFEGKTGRLEWEAEIGRRFKLIKWLDVEEIKSGDHDVAPNIKFLIEKGDIK